MYCRSINKTDLDFNYITNRLGVMSFPAEGLESTYKNHIDDVKTFLETRHGPDHYAVYNLCQRQYKGYKFNNRVKNVSEIIVENVLESVFFPSLEVSECCFADKKAPSLEQIFACSKNMYLWLRQDPKNVCVVHCSVIIIIIINRSENYLIYAGKSF